MKFIATAKLGLESVVASELKHMNMENVTAYDARVTFTGDFYDMAKACLYLRCAERLLLCVSEFKATTFDQLFEGVKAVNWKDYIARDTFIHVNGKSAKSTLFSVSDCQSITKKAIVENLKAAYNTSIIPETGKKVIVEVGLLKDEVTVALDCCGAGLSRRGYRTYNVPAPISETLGAAIVMLSRYKADMPFIDPMCGSGTMPIEAAMIANNMAVGAGRSFAFEEWHFFDEKLAKRAREEAADCVLNNKLDILGCDIDAHSIELCKKHAKKAGIMVNWAVADIKNFTTEKNGGVLVCNPPYGERMFEKKEAEALYRVMSRHFSKLTDWQRSIITSHSDFERVYGMKADKRRKLSNGGMPCTLYQYFPKKDR